MDINSEIYKAARILHEYCNPTRSCEECEFCEGRKDEYFICSVAGIPQNWRLFKDE